MKKVKNTKKRVTIKDVASKAGVTIGTVSHVINGTATISAPTTDRVQEAINELGYVPNYVARNMCSKENRIIGLLIPKLINNFYTEIIAPFMEKAYKENYTVLIVSYEYSLQKEKEALKTLNQNNVGTVIIFNGYEDEKYIQSMSDQGVRIIFADRRTEIKGIPYIKFDNIKVMVKTVGFLKQKGYQRIGFISESLSINNLEDRYSGYKAGLMKYGYSYEPKYVFISDTFRENHIKYGYIYMKKLLNKMDKATLPDAFITSSDSLAIGIIKAMVQAGYKVPGDFGIVGCDNIDFGIYMQPALTTINQDRQMMEQALWHLLKAYQDDGLVQGVTLSQELIIRESC